MKEINTTEQNTTKQQSEKNLERGGGVHGAAKVRAGLGTGRGRALPLLYSTLLLPLLVSSG